MSPATGPTRPPTPKTTTATPGAGTGDVAELSDRAARMAALLEEWPRRTLNLERVWALWDSADPASAGRPTRRADLAAALSALSAAGVVSLSKTKDTTASPALPTRVTLPPAAPTPSATALAARTAWRPELDWVTETRLTLSQVERLRAINTWLRDHGSGSDVMPLRERSLQVFGHEKVLDGLVGTSLFAPGRLSYDLLRTFRTHPPLPSRHVGNGDVLLVVENEDTFHTLWDELMTDPGPVGHIAWGAGGAFEASVRSTGDLHGIRRTVYFGDLDVAGLRIPTAAAATAVSQHLPAVAPANILYRMLLHHGRPQGGATVVPAEQAEPLTAWLEDPQLRTSAAALLTQGHRLAQEAVTKHALHQAQGWQNTL